MTKIQIDTLHYERPDSPRGKCYFAAREVAGDWGIVGWGGGDTPGQFKQFPAATVAKKVREKQAEGYESVQSFEADVPDQITTLTPQQIYGAVVRETTATPVPSVTPPVPSAARSFVSAQLCESSAIDDLDTFVHDDAWAIERKWDGHRVLVRVVDNVPSFLNRTGAEYGHGVSPCVRGAFSCDLDGEWLFDGELIGDDYYAFDVLTAAGEDVRSKTWTERRSILFDRAPLAVCVHISDVALTADEKVALIKEVVDAGGEGFVVKHIGRPYQSGRVSHWRKIKWVSTADVIVSEVKRQGKDSIGMTLFKDGRLIPVGACNMQGKVDRMNALQPGDVVEVRYLSCFGQANGYKLVQPEFLGKRDDKPATDCTVDQLRISDKNRK